MTPMTKDEYNEARTALGLSVVGARVLGIKRRQAQRLAAGDAEVPQPLAFLMRVLVAKKIPVGYLEKLK